MIDPESLRFTIGEGDWLREIRSFTDQFDRHYWDDFRPCTAGEIAACEREIRRLLPDDLREFLLRVGAGNFGERGGGNIYTPEEIVLATPGPLFQLLGSSDWASDEDHRRYYATRGSFNPCPERFTEEALIRDGVNLLDLVQVGSNGQCCYHLLNVSGRPRPFGYCLLETDGSFVDQLPSFSEALRHIIILDWEYSQGMHESSPGLGLADFIIDESDGYEDEDAL